MADNSQTPLKPPPLDWLDGGHLDNVHQIYEDRRRRFIAAANSGPTFVPLPLAATLSAQSSLIANATVQKARAPARSEIGKAVLQNIDAIELAGLSFLALIKERLEALKQERLNTDEANQQIADLDDLKRRVEEFLGAATQFKADEALERTVVAARFSLANGLNNIWEKRHLQIADVGLFGIAVLICQMADPLSVAVAGTVVGGKTVADAIKAAMKRDH